MMLIDPPSPFASEQEWRVFLDEMKSLQPEAPDDAALVQRCIKLAKQALSVPLDNPLFVCPNCRKRRGVNISYGYPSLDLWEQVERGEAVLGGCMQEIGAPDRQCLDCGHQWEIVRRKPSTDMMFATG